MNSIRNKCDRHKNSVTFGHHASYSVTYGHRFRVLFQPTECNANQ